MFDDLILKEQTEKQLQTILDEPRQSYMLVGPPAIGKFTSTLYAASKIINTESQSQIEQIKNGQHKDLFIVRREEDNKSIAIDQIHELQNILKLKPDANQKRIVVIKDAHYLSLPAQNALLKLFEEVPRNATIFLTTNNQQKIIPTIHSRAYHIHFHIPSKEKILDLIKNLSEGTRELVEAFGIRNPGILHRLATDQQFSEQWNEIYHTASQLIEKDIFHKLSLVNEITNDNRKTEKILDALGRYYRNELLMSKNEAESEGIRTAVHRLSAIEDAKRHFAYNVNHKLTISNLMLHL